MVDMTHLFEVSSSHGSQALFLYEVTGAEELGKPFHHSVTLLSEDKVIIEDLVGHTLSLKIQNSDGSPYRYYHGVVAEATAAGVLGAYYRTVVTLRPWFWLLNLSSDNRVFQEKTVVDIVKEVFSDLGFSDYKNKLSGSYRTRDYCVQYGETDFDFVSRLLEEEGIYYYFEHQESKHEMVLCDSSGSHSPCAMSDGSNELVYRLPEEGRAGQEFISRWQPTRTLDSQKVTLESYNFEASTTSLQKVNSLQRSHPHAGMERYEYGQLLTEPVDVQLMADVRRESLSARYSTVQGRANAPGVAVGGHLKLAEHPDNAENDEYLVIRTSIQLRNSALEVLAETEGAIYEVEFLATKRPAAYRPARVTPRAVVKGPQTAVVVGPSGEEIWTDKYGRVKVQFHWDRVGGNDENSSCWVRVATTWAGNTWGAISLPRMGQEVIVDFLEGDPDQPIITGSVYNDKNMPPYSLPDNKTQSGLKTRSTKDGTTKTFNELRFEDKKDSEEIYFHAEKDFMRVVENNDHLIVGKEDKDKGDQTVEIHNDRTVTLDEGTDKLTVKKGDRVATITEGDDNLDVEGGNQTINVAHKIAIDAGDELKITVGQASLTMKSNGDITLKGKNITVDGTGKVTCKAVQDFSASGMNAKVDAKMGAEMTGLTAKVEGKTTTTVDGKLMLDLKSSTMAKLKGAINMIG